MKTDALDIARQLASSFRTRADEADKTGVLPQEDIEELKASGFLGFSVPKEFGGRGLSLGDCTAAQLELAKGSTSSALIACMQLHIFGSSRENDPFNNDIFEQFCALAVQGETFNFVSSEPTLGSPSRGGLPETHAELSSDGQSLILHGHKNWVTAGHHLDNMLVRLAYKDEASVVWVPQTTEGLRWEHTWKNALSLRASNSNDLFIEGATVSVNNLIQDKSSLGIGRTWFTMLVAATYLGAALAARDEVIRYCLERVPTALGRPIATLPKIQRQLGEIDVGLYAAKTVLLEVANQWHNDDADLREKHREQHFVGVTAAKELAIETALEVTQTAIRIAGGASIGASSESLALERYFRDVRAGLMHPPSGDIALELVGKAASNYKGLDI